jgi:hypothetical protein
VNFGDPADKHPDGMAETDPLERTEVGVDDEHDVHQILLSVVAGRWAGAADWA